MTSTSWCKVHTQLISSPRWQCQLLTWLDRCQVYLSAIQMGVMGHLLLVVSSYR